MKTSRKLLIIAFWLLLWQALAFLIHNSILMVGPVETLRSLGAMLRTTMFWQSLAFSFVRIIAGFLIGSALGILLAWESYRRPFLEELLAPFILALKAVPVASFVIILLIWAGNRMLSLYISALVVLPLLYLNTLGGLKATDPKLLLLDEPAAGMNPQETIELTNFIRSVRDEFGLTIFLIEHHMNLVMDISDRIYVIDFGKQIAAGVPAEIQNDQRVIDAYLGVDEDA